MAVTNMEILFCAIVITIIRFASAEICSSNICEYTFDIRHGRTMTYHWEDETYNVILDGQELTTENPDRFKRPTPDTIPVDDVITADGVQRNILTVNGQFPGPTIEVMEGAQIVVHVTNNLMTQSVSFHWHGIHQEGTPWMDGVSYVTQCPIIPGQSFTYRFYANPVGTHWYHDHTKNLRIEGLYGMFVVHAKPPTIPEYTLMVTDWFHAEAHTFEITNIKGQGGGDHNEYLFAREYGPDGVSLSPYTFLSALINGRGRFEDNEAPLSTFSVTSGETYRFRMVSAASKYGLELMIDGHKLQVVALDGHEISPVEVNSIITHPGETLDFTVKADQSSGNFWMRSLILRLGKGPRPTDDGIEKGTYAVVRYEGAPDMMPTTTRDACTSQDACVVFNCPWEGYAESMHKRCIQIDETKSTTPQKVLDVKYGLSGSVDLELFLNVGYHFGNAINGKRMVFPKLPWSEKNYLDGQLSCDMPGCKVEDAGCACTQVVNLPYNKTIQLVMANYRMRGSNHHAMHLHGHNFAVLKVALPAYNATSGFVGPFNPDLRCVNPFCKEVEWTTDDILLNLHQPPVKNTVNVANKAYTIVRFRTTNPGPWLFHCHTSNHMFGMSLVFEEAHNKFPRPPKKFPKCPSFNWSKDDFEKYMAHDPEAFEPLDESDFKSTESNDRNMNRTPKDSSSVTNSKRLDEIDLETHIILSNKNFIALILGSVALGAVLVILVLLVVLCCRKAGK